MDQFIKMAVKKHKESGEMSSTKKLQTLPIEVPPISLEKIEKRIDMSINDNVELRESLIGRCETIVHDIIEQLCAGRMPSVSYRIPTMETLTEQVESLDSELHNSENNAESLVNLENGQSTVFEIPESIEIDDFETENEESPEEIPGQRNVVDFRRKRSRVKLALMMTVIANIHYLLRNNTTETRRSLFYELKNGAITSTLVNNQIQIDQTVENVANLLECSPWDTGLIGTTKGLAAGDLTLTLENNTNIDYNVPGGVLIPQFVTNLISIKSKADLVIVVEKDTIFQKLLQEMCPSVLNCILVTGKGYPDVPTRMLVKILAEKVGLPVYILVDADPYGIEIMLNYKYGSVNLCHDQKNLACPSARWIGVHPSELSGFTIEKLPLTDADVAKLDALHSRLYIGEKIARELEFMREGKAEIETITGLTSMYLPMKIKSNDYL